MTVMNAAVPTRSSEIAPTCSVLSILLPVAGRWIGCHGVRCAEMQSDPRVLIQFLFCVGGTVLLGVVLAIIAAFRREPLGGRIFAGVFQCLALAWVVAAVMR